MVVSGPHDSEEPTLAQLVDDLVSDVKELLHHELALAKYEISAELHQTKVALVFVGIGIGIVSVGGLLLIAMFVHLLHTRTGLPLWACYGMVGGLLGLVGIVMINRGKRIISRVDVVPQQTIGTMKENLRWIKAKSLLNKT
jgi:Putative Actinobacterial Holin-X, holin superfamily III